MVLRLWTPLTGLRPRLSTRDGRCGQKISYFHHWIVGEGMGKIESWKNKKVLISAEEYDKLVKTQKEGKYFSEKIESYFNLFEYLLAPR